MSYMYSKYTCIQNIYIISQRITKCQAKNEQKAIKNNVQDAMLKGGIKYGFLDHMKIIT